MNTPFKVVRPNGLGVRCYVGGGWGWSSLPTEFRWFATADLAEAFIHAHCRDYPDAHVMPVDAADVADYSGGWNPPAPPLVVIAGARG